MTSFKIFKRINKKSISETETQKYETLLKEGNFEIRYYPAAIMASVKMDGTYESKKKNGFNMLAGYIFGGNSEHRKISMTKPVHISIEKEGGGMSFVMPSEFDFDNLPEPDSKKVFLHKTEPVYVASYQFSGFSNNRKIESGKQKLKQFLKEKGIEHLGKFEYLGYNSPYKMMNRRNEVIFHLKETDVKMIEGIV